MKSFKELTENKKLFIDVWHGSRSKFEPPFKENLQGSENDEGFSGRGFIFLVKKRMLNTQFLMAIKESLELN